MVEKHEDEDTHFHKHIEAQIRKASEGLQEGDVPGVTAGAPIGPAAGLDMEQLSRRAHRELVLRDAVHMGFGHLLTTVLTLVAGIHQYFNKLKKENTRDGQS